MSSYYIIIIVFIGESFWNSIWNTFITFLLFILASLGLIALINIFKL